MKKRIIVGLMAMLLLSSVVLTSCESDAERKLRNAKDAAAQAERAADKAAEKYNDLKDSLDKIGY